LRAPVTTAINQSRFQAAWRDALNHRGGSYAQANSGRPCLCLIWIGYIAWPLYDLLVLLHAIETRDIDTVTRHVYFDSVRISLTNQVVAAYVRRTGIQMGPLRRNIAAAAIADPVVKRLVSPEALSELLAVGWPITVLSDPPAGTIGITRSTMGTIWQIFGSSE
jgi:hypothetical protein